MSRFNLDGLCSRLALLQSKEATQQALVDKIQADLAKEKGILAGIVRKRAICDSMIKAEKAKIH